jgi:hypothetical protein
MQADTAIVRNAVRIREQSCGTATTDVQLSQKTWHFRQRLQRTLVLFTLNDLLRTAPN